MGRRKGSLNKPKGMEEGIERPALTEEQLEALTNQHARKYSDALAVKKEADADLKNICKIAKSEGVPLKHIKAYLDGKTEEGQARIKEDTLLYARIARWNGFSLGTQADLFAEDPAPAANRSFRLGKEAGLAGEKAVPPTSCDINAFMAGHQTGQAMLMSQNISQLPAAAE